MLFLVVVLIQKKEFISEAIRIELSEMKCENANESLSVCLCVRKHIQSKIMNTLCFPFGLRLTERIVHLFGFQLNNGFFTCIRVESATSKFSPSIHTVHANARTCTCTCICTCTRQKGRNFPFSLETHRVEATNSIQGVFFYFYVDTSTNPFYTWKVIIARKNARI